jgi:hypothetical protein
MAFGQEVDLKAVTIFARCGLGKVAWVQADNELAIKKFGEALKMSLESGFKHGKFHALYGLGRVARSQDDYLRARTDYMEMLEVQRQQIHPLFQWNWLQTYGCAAAYALEGFAILAAAQNQMQRASRLLCAAQNLYLPLRYEMSAKERAEHDQALAAARAGLGKKMFEKAWAEGKGMTLEEAVAYALEES